MNRESILGKMKELVQPYVGDNGAFEGMNESSDLVNDLKINSAHIVDIVLDIESEFDIMIDDQSINEMVTVGSSIDVIEAKLAVAAG